MSTTVYGGHITWIVAELASKLGRIKIAVIKINKCCRSWPWLDRDRTEWCASGRVQALCHSGWNWRPSRWHESYWGTARWGSCFCQGRRRSCRCLTISTRPLCMHSLQTQSGVWPLLPLPTNTNHMGLLVMPLFLLILLLPVPSHYPHPTTTNPTTTNPHCQYSHGCIYVCTAAEARKNVACQGSWIITF